MQVGSWIEEIWEMEDFVDSSTTHMGSGYLAWKHNLSGQYCEPDAKVFNEKVI